MAEKGSGYVFFSNSGSSSQNASSLVGFPSWQVCNRKAAGVSLLFLAFLGVAARAFGTNWSLSSVAETSLRGNGNNEGFDASVLIAVVSKDGPGGPGAPVAKQVVVAMDTNILFHTAFDDWEAWSKEMKPYWTDDMVYDFSYVGEWGFGPTRGLYAWFNGEHLHYNIALPDCQFTDLIRAANDVNCTSASYGLARWTAPIAGVPPPANKPWVRVRDIDFFLLEAKKIKINWCMIDIVDLFLQVGYKVLPEPPMLTDGYLAPRAMDGGIAPVSALVDPRDTVEAEKVWRAALEEDYLDKAGVARWWAESMIWYGPGGIGTAHSRADYRKHFLEPLHKAFSSMTLQIDSLTCEGKYCGAHMYVYGNHTGTWLGEDATGQRVPIRCGAHARIENGQIVEGWLIIDLPRAFKAMGVDLFARAKASALQRL